MAQQGISAAGEDGGHPAPPLGEAGVSDGIDAAVEGVEVAGADQLAQQLPWRQIGARRRTKGRAERKKSCAA